MQGTIKFHIIIGLWKAEKAMSGSDVNNLEILVLGRFILRVYPIHIESIMVPMLLPVIDIFFFFGILGLQEW